MDNVQVSRVESSFTVRVTVIISELDYGSVERVIENVITKEGNPDTTFLELLAILRAKEVCEEKGITDFVIYSDNEQAVARTSSPQVKWLPPGQLHYASAFLHRILSRARYLRHSSRKVRRRAPVRPAQMEVFILFQAERLEFKLSRSLLWAKIRGTVAIADKVS